MIMIIEKFEWQNALINNLTIKSKNDLRKKLQEGEDDIKNGNVIPLDDVFDEIDNLLK